MRAYNFVYTKESAVFIVYMLWSRPGPNEFISKEGSMDMEPEVPQ